MADSFVQLPPDSTGRKVDTSVLTDPTNALGQVERQRIVIGDDDNPNGLAQVDGGGLHVADDTLTLLLAALLSRMPLPNISDQMRVAIEAALPTGANTIGAVNIAAAQTLATLTNLAQIGAQPANTTVFDMMNAAANQLYNGIQVT